MGRGVGDGVGGCGVIVALWRARRFCTWRFDDVYDEYDERVT
jgi:hypothetical protein